MTDDMPDLKSEDAIAFWREAVEAYEFSIGERLILKQVVREIDMIERLQTEADKKDGLEVRGSQGQPVMAGQVAELRQHRAVLSSLLKQLGLGDTAATDAQNSIRARQAAMARWHRKPAVLRGAQTG